MALGDNRFIHGSGSPTVTINGQSITGIKDITIDANQNTSSYNVSINTAMTTAAGSMQQLGNAFSQAGCVTTDLNTMFAPSCMNHVTHEELIEYQDDLVIAYCVNCEARITINRVPGGLNKLKMTNILSLMRECPDDDSILPVIVDLQAAVETEIEELQNALFLLAAARNQACKQLLP